jgi:hypothetical protein
VEQPENAVLRAKPAAQNAGEDTGGRPDGDAESAGSGAAPRQANDEAAAIARGRAREVAPPADDAAVPKKRSFAGDEASSPAGGETETDSRSQANPVIDETLSEERLIPKRRRRLSADEIRERDRSDSGSGPRDRAAYAIQEEVAKPAQDSDANAALPDSTGESRRRPRIRAMDGQ